MVEGCGALGDATKVPQLELRPIRASPIAMAGLDAAWEPHETASTRRPIVSRRVIWYAMVHLRLGTCGMSSHQVQLPRWVRVPHALDARYLASDPRLASRLVKSLRTSSFLSPSVCIYLPYILTLTVEHNGCK
jgi:hypothetical protein